MKSGRLAIFDLAILCFKNLDIHLTTNFAKMIGYMMVPLNFFYH